MINNIEDIVHRVLEQVVVIGFIKSLIGVLASYFFSKSVLNVRIMTSCIVVCDWKESFTSLLSSLETEEIRLVSGTVKLVLVFNHTEKIVPNNEH